jgi:hypothetical protein
MSSLFTNEQYWTVRITNAAITMLSLVGEIYMISSYYSSKPRQRTLPMKLVHVLVISNLVYSLCNALSYVDGGETFCFIEGFFQTSSYIFSLLWIQVILLLVYKQIMNFRSRIHGYFNALVLFATFLSCIPGIIVTIVYLMNGGMYFGVDSFSFCTIFPSDAYYILQALPTIVLTIMAWILAALIVYYIRQEVGVSEDGREYKAILRYPFVLFICQFPLFLDSLVSKLNDGKPLFFFVLLHIIAVRSAGWMNAIVYRRKSPSMKTERIESKTSECSIFDRKSILGQH